MKKMIFLALITSLALNANAQRVSSAKVPKAAKKAFVKAHATVKQLHWEIENGNYEANWTLNGFDHSAMYSPGGKFVGSETDIRPSELPAAAKEYLQKKYHLTVKEASLNEDKNGMKSYEADAKGVAYFFDMHGRFLKTGKDN